jgi:asparagine synthase (glutamine-hydrolysing)
VSADRPEAMCGLVGILDRRVAPEDSILRRMTATLAHRGPDGEGYVTRGACAFGFRRLAIVDVNAHPPPFSNEDRTVWSVANAEIYNGTELRTGLEQRGHALATHVDTEVIPHLWEELGLGLVSHLNGMFSLAVWDERKQTLLLARDRAGEKPLFYCQGEDGSLVFASELRALLAHPRTRRTLDAVSLRRYLLHDFFPAPATPLAGVRKLPAAHLLVARPEGISVRSYWDLAASFSNPELARRRPDDIAEELDARIALAVARRRISDVPLGVFLSGGIDSSTVLAHLAEHHGPGVPAFALGHADPEFDESRFARDTSNYFEAEFHPLVLDETDLAEGLRRVGEGFDEPLGDASTIPSHLLALHARRHVKVVLSGEGADECFAGYPTYLGHRIAGWYRRIPRPLRRALLAAAARAPVTMGNVGPAYLLRRFASAAERGTIERHHLWFGSLGPELGESVIAPEIVELLRDDDPFAAASSRLAGRELPDELARLLYTDFTMYLQDDLLTKVDRATMLASLEARAPFLDHELVEFAAGIPSHLKLSWFQTKAILRRAVRRRLPKTVLARRKRGFNIPFSRWLLHGLGDQLRARFTPERVVTRGLLSPAGVERLLNEHLESRADHRKPLFNLLALDLWCDKVFGEGARVPVERGEAVPTASEAVLP